MSLGNLYASGGGGGGAGAGVGGDGRIAIYHEGSLSYSGSNPAPYAGNFPTPGPSLTPTITPTSILVPTPTTEPGWNGNQYHYEGAQAHAVTSVDRPLGTDSFEYDPNGNMVERVEGEVTWAQGFNAENRLSSITDGEGTWTFVYDGDGNRVKQIHPDGSITLFLGGGIYTVEDAADSAAVTKYYSIAGQRLAMANNEGLQFLLTDHLGSVSAVLDDTGALLSQQRYLPFGGERQIGGGVYETDFGYTGQRDLDAVGLMDYNARWYNTDIQLFTSPDPVSSERSGAAQSNRFSYVNNNPISFIDPSGYRPIGPCGYQGQICQNKASL